MLNSPRQLVDVLWPDSLPPHVSARQSLFAIVDGARDVRIYVEVGWCLEKVCLYAGDLPRQLEMNAPYLVHLMRGDRFARTLLREGWGNGWGIFVRTEVGMDKLRRHLRGFLRVQDENNRRLIFRYYDPQVLCDYLPTCRPSELETVFGPVDSYLVEDVGGKEIIEFRLEGGKLVSSRIPLELAQASR